MDIGQMDPMDTMSNGHNGSNGHCVQWTQWIQQTQCSMDTMSNGHNGSNGHVQWCSMDPKDTMDPSDTMDTKDKNTKLMFTLQTRFCEGAHWIHSDGSILDIHWIHWTCPLNIGNGSIGSTEHRWTTLPMDMMDAMDPLD